MATIFFSLPLLILLNKDPWFPEYYFHAYLVPITITLTLSLKYSTSPKRLRLVLLGVLIILLSHGNYYLNFSRRLPYSLSIKTNVVQFISTHSMTVDLRSEVSPGRNQGFEYLFRYYNIQIDQNSPHKIVLKDSNDTSISMIADQEPSETMHFGGYRVDYFQML